MIEFVSVPQHFLLFCNEAILLYNSDDASQENAHPSWPQNIIPKSQSITTSWFQNVFRAGLISQNSHATRKKRKKEKKKAHRAGLRARSISSKDRPFVSTTLPAM